VVLVTRGGPSSRTPVVDKALNRVTALRGQRLTGKHGTGFKAYPLEAPFHITTASSEITPSTNSHAPTDFHASGNQLTHS
jgi:hypothetical protein